tara:strand:+ start:310 stop:426 length:117 start_codon:yes stop_codon:yes gene_type:complete
MDMSDEEFLSFNSSPLTRKGLLAQILLVSGIIVLLATL